MEEEESLVVGESPITTTKLSWSQQGQRRQDNNSSHDDDDDDDEAANGCRGARKAATDDDLLAGKGRIQLRSEESLRCSHVNVTAEKDRIRAQSSVVDAAMVSNILTEKERKERIQARSDRAAPRSACAHRRSGAYSVRGILGSRSSSVDSELVFEMEEDARTHDDTLALDEDGDVTQRTETSLYEHLPVAKPVEGEDGPASSLTLQTAGAYDPGSKPLLQNERFRLYASFAFLVLVVVAIGASIGATLVRKADNTPTAAPTTYRETLGIETLVKRVVGSDVLEDPNSPYSKAIDWITFEDPIQLTPDAANFIQRYITAYIYYAIGPWKSCNQPDDSSRTTCTWSKLNNRQYYYEYRNRTANAWLSNITECKWAGVTCDNTGQIIKLDVSGQGASGGLFPEGIIDNLPFLTGFDFTLGSLRGTLPSMLGNMRHLSRVLLGRNQFTGPIPNDWWTSSWAWNQLTLSNNLITGSLSSQIGLMSDLKTFHAANNSLTQTLPSEIGLLDSIANFDVSGNKISGTIPSTIGLWQSLSTLELHKNLLEGSVPTAIGQLSSLVVLSLYANPRISGQIPESLYNLRELRTLDIRNCNFSGTLSPSLGQLGSNLWYLSISRNNFHGKIPTELVQLSELYQFWLHDNDLTGTFPTGLCALQNRDISAERLTEVVADCTPDSSGYTELHCSCCTICCKPDGTECLSVEP